MSDTTLYTLSEPSSYRATGILELKFYEKSLITRILSKPVLQLGIIPTAVHSEQLYSRVHTMQVGSRESSPRDEHADASRKL
jgi:hypothetical protein